MKMAKGFLLYMMIHCPFFIHVNGRVIVLTTKLLLKSTFVNSPGFFLFWYIDPRKVTRPSESSDLKVVAVVSIILQGFVIDDVDDRGSENSGVLSNP